MPRSIALLALLFAVGAAEQPAPGFSTPLDFIDLPSAPIVAQHSTRDVALEVAFSADDTLLSWRCTVSPHPSL